MLKDEGNAAIFNSCPAGNHVLLSSHPLPDDHVYGAPDYSWDAYLQSKLIMNKICIRRVCPKKDQIRLFVAGKSKISVLYETIDTTLVPFYNITVLYHHTPTQHPVRKNNLHTNRTSLHFACQKVIPYQMSMKEHYYKLCECSIPNEKTV